MREPASGSPVMKRNRSSTSPDEQAGRAPGAGPSGCEAAFRAIAAEALAAIAARQAKAAAGDAEAVHQLRMALTRLRAARSFFAAMVRDDRWRALKPELAWLNRRLGAVRDRDVMRNFARRKAYREWAEKAGIAGHLAGARHRRRLAKALRSGRYRRLMAALAQWSEAGPWRSRTDVRSRRRRAAPLRSYAGRALRSWRKRIVRMGRDIETLDADARHEVRIEAKRYRYMLEALAGLEPAQADEWRESGRRARRVQRALGELRDLQCFRKLGGKHARRPPGYRRSKKRLLRQAGAAIGRL